ncbi:DUF1611 domain-containing protein [Streptomyces somaliensis]|uniref:DUF1611 domain-containing protein n=1 Tax=Streptomyces somaliensis TaxID=78355 RepID=UPI0020CCB29C|nr:DUF1611 domain-containing protein [Streptomyces somaliensis]MCP9946870.1 DUF1611 domain-containing protein [Streptomyces somaliensis]MCP9963508.1 DUF1611 domain-containing protein [Streptomyces somaliensis]MCP9976218.1 DUF1611 domain-containing protein [Streptomyces somaliensis]
MPPQSAGIRGSGGQSRTGGGTGRRHPDPARAARENDITIRETRDPPVVPLDKARVLDLDAWIIRTCGSGSDTGKKTAAPQLSCEANRRGAKRGSAATRQSGMVISGRGAAVDGVPGGFTGGSVEQVVVAAWNRW